MRWTLRLAPIAVVLLLVLAFTRPTDAAKRTVPFGFFGTVLHPMPAAALEPQAELMARSGVESGRVIVLWNFFETARGEYNWAALDGLVAAAARHNISLLVNLTETPQWASSHPTDPEFSRWPPVDNGDYAEAIRQIALRYRTSSAFWKQHPEVTKPVPIRHFQIWNEQTAPWHWQPRPWAPGYTKLLKAAYQAIKRVDRGAKVVAGSLVAYGSGYAPWDAIRDLYKAGARRWFDEVAVHPFTNAPTPKSAATQTLEIVRRVRAGMDKAHDRRKPILVTEMTWPAALGQVPGTSLEQAAGLGVDAAGQASRLTRAYKLLASNRRKLRVSQVYWYAWSTEYDQNSATSVMAFRYSGLTSFSGTVFKTKPILRTYSKLAAKYEGCRKGPNARRCR